MARHGARCITKPHTRNSRGAVGFLGALAVACVPLRAAIHDTTADAVLGQIDFTQNTFNQPNGIPSASNLSLPAAAPDVAIAANGRLYIADADNNRILSWPSAPAFTNGAAADMVFGQPDFTSGNPNNGGISPGSLGFPQGVWVDSAANLWVTDAFNHRVLKYNNPPATDALADLVIGQADMTSGLENMGNGMAGPDTARADGLLFPGRVIVVGSYVFVGDSGNSRVTRYSNVTSNTPSADKVWGQLGSFTCRAKNNIGTCVDTQTATADNLFNPIGLALDSRGDLWVADWNNNRVLCYFDARNGDTTADIVLGQANFTGRAENRGGGPAANTLNRPIDLVFDGMGRLMIADSVNHRVVTVPQPRAANAAATGVFGQLANLNTRDVNHGLGPTATDADGLAGPTGVSIDSSRNLYILDTDNQRLLRFDRPLRGHVPVLRDSP
jgi:sugar lactone lactonase YvrE